MANYGTDDLTPTLAAQPATGVGYRQGIVQAWNPETAENTIEVGGVLVENLSILNTNEAVQLQPGDVVGILSTGGPTASWAILGRLTIPGTDAAASALRMVSSRIIAARDDAMGTRDTETYGDLTGASPGPSVSARISSSGLALVFWSADAGKIAWRRVATGGTSVAVSGATTIAANPAYSLGQYLEYPVIGDVGAAFVAGGLQSAMMHLFTGLNPGVNTFTLKYRHAGAFTGEGPVEFTQREIAVFAL
ncbi:hypothetical protein MED01_002402 [Micromonospora sp. MED01]|uniref:hypothetical protein n=1 Tax=Micromonospora alfalfae TaxID=2911212 RepID=UPI001EE96602|nr:hypothetical protein [Micromonospora alfalfae]MCG5464237.1 hypothetical protein [Micromonospora alfalfae]